MYLKLIRNKAKGNAITGRLVIDGRWFCYTLERVGYQIPALCYHVAVTQSPKFKRLLPLVCGVPQTVGDKATGDKAMRQGIRFHRGTKPEHSTGCILVLGDNELKTTQTTISQTNTVCDKENDSLARCDVGTAQMLSKLSLENNELKTTQTTISQTNTVCDKENDSLARRDVGTAQMLSKLSLENNELKTTQTTISQTNTVCDKENDSLARCDVGTAQMLSKLSLELNISPVVVGSRTSADVEKELTQLLLQTQNNHEEIILEVIDYRPGSDLGYDTPCPPELQKR